MFPCQISWWEKLWNQRGSQEIAVMAYVDGNTNWLESLLLRFLLLTHTITAISQLFPLLFHLFHIGHFKQGHTVFFFSFFLQLGCFWILINTVSQYSPASPFLVILFLIKLMLLHTRLEGIMIQIFIIILFRISSKIVSLCSLLCSKSTYYSQYSQLYRRIFTTFFTFAIKNFENIL